MRICAPRLPHFLVVFLVISAIAQPADARRRMFIPMGSSSGETIDRVHDLPDTDIFKRDGEYFDLGFLYKRRSIMGLTTSSDRELGSYVLYHGDRYVRLDDRGMTMLKGALGFDPTSTYAGGPKERANARETTTRATLNGGRYNPPPSSAGSVDAARPAIKSSGLGGWGWLVAIVMIGGLFFARKLMRGIFGLARAVSSGEAGEAAKGSTHDSFESRVAARLAELQAGDNAGTVAMSAAPGPTRVTRGFGRKVV